MDLRNCEKWEFRILKTQLSDDGNNGEIDRRKRRWQYKHDDRIVTEGGRNCESKQEEEWNREIKLMID